jgi:hypothetical protein
MSGRELDPDGTDSYHPQHPWEQVGHPLYLPPDLRTLVNWPPERARPAGWYEASVWDQLPVRAQPEPAWDREYGPWTKPSSRSLRCALGVHAWGAPRMRTLSTWPMHRGDSVRTCRRCGASR